MKIVKGGIENNSMIYKLNTIQEPESEKHIDELHNDLYITNIIKQKLEVCKN